MTENFYTTNGCDGCDKYQVWVPGIVHFFWWYRNRYRKNLVPEKSLGTGIGKIEYRKKVSEPVSRKCGTEKSTGIGIENICYRIKVSVSVSFNILGTVTHCLSGKTIQNYSEYGPKLKALVVNSNGKKTCDSILFVMNRVLFMMNKDVWGP